MRTKAKWAISLLIATGAGAQDLAAQTFNNLVLNTITPCRIVDTRITASGDHPLVAGETRGFNVFGTDLSSQGGASTGCAIPGLSSGIPQTFAIAVNLVAVTPQSLGTLKGWAGDIAEPDHAAIVTYQALNPNLNIANATPLAVRTTGTLGNGQDIMIKANGGGTGVVADVVGYYGVVSATSSGGLFSGKIAMPTPTSGAFTAFGYANGFTPGTETCQACDPSNVSVLSPSISCTARDLAIKVIATPGGGSTRTVTLFVNGQPTVVSCTATDPTVTCDSGANGVAVPSASDLAIQFSQDANGSALSGVEFGFACN